MGNEVTGSMKEECDKRLDTLYRNSHEWLLKCSYNICKSFPESEELTSDLYVYLAKECRPKLFWGNSYNLIYCHKFLKHRWLNRAEKLGRFKNTADIMVMDKADTEYDIEGDIAVMKAYDEVLEELKGLQTNHKLWAPARLYEMYWMSEDTLNEVAKKIGISKSTCFLSIKRIRKHMAEAIDNPFKK